ncbi:MAG: nucleoside monophosphate kinase [Spirochaetota bacterium]|nr:nucleoside monophosphate kinase [Spirochaetota bacterium]
MNKKIIFLGYPGSGKGTQSSLLSKEFNIYSLSTGDAFRQMIQEGKGEVADRVKSCINEGRLVSDELTFEVVKKNLPSIDKSWILDGFPRNLNQAKILNEFSPPTDVILVDIDEKIIFQRLTGRRLAKSSGKMYNVFLNPSKMEGVCDESGEELIQRDDDMPEVVQKRLTVYRMETEPLIKFYQDKGILKKIAGNSSINEVYSNLREVLGF